MQEEKIKAPEALKVGIAILAVTTSLLSFN